MADNLILAISFGFKLNSNLKQIYIKFNKFRTDLISDQKNVRKLIRPKFFGVRNFCHLKIFPS